MYYEELGKQIDFLMRAALQKCGDVQEAEDLTQETLLAALFSLSKGRHIENLQGFLLGVMNHKFYDLLRKKYRQPFVDIGCDFDMIDEEDAIEKIVAGDDAEEVRREVAYLAEIYREVIVRHYMNGQSVAEIAAALNLPEGTVKRRLYTGRNRIKEGISQMENYTKQSYEPVRLNVNNSGGRGYHGEPTSLACNDLIAQNLLWLAYEKPVTADELSRAIGVPTAYVEPVIERLTRGELMKNVGNRYYTDFLISTPEDQEKHIPAQKQFVGEHFDLLWRRVEEGLCEIRESGLFGRLNFDQRNSLELYFAFKCLEEGYYGAFHGIYRTEASFPRRPDGGSWIALGLVYPRDFRQEEHRELLSCMWSGERRIRYENYGGSKRIELHVYGTEGFPAPTYAHCFDDIPCLQGTGIDDKVLKLLYIIQEGLDISRVGFETEALRAIPYLIKCRVLRMETQKRSMKENLPAVNIPVLDGQEADGLWKLCQGTSRDMKEDIRDILAAFLKGKRQSVPPHLDSVPLQKQYLWAMQALMLTTIREAIGHERLYDGDYDNESGANPPPCPMIMIIEK